MLPRHISAALAKQLPVLFAYIGWTNEYDGTEPILGSHGYLKAHPEDRNTCEAQAFIREKGKFSCGIGRGKAPSRLHVVFVAREPTGGEMQVVGVYASAILETRSDWSFAKTRTAVLIPVDRRPKLTASWPEGQGIRRWASRDHGQTHRSLLRYFNRLRILLPKVLANRPPSPDGDQTYDIGAREGKKRSILISHRTREVRLRKAKIHQTLKSSDGHLACEVPGCGFDFLAKYGNLGDRYAHVHHLVPLAGVSKKGKKTSLDELAIVCANCHAMIHRGGECRDLKKLIPNVRVKRTRSELAESLH